MGGCGGCGAPADMREAVKKKEKKSSLLLSMGRVNWNINTSVSSWVSLGDKEKSENKKTNKQHPYRGADCVATEKAPPQIPPTRV